jgi:hypothetical protein
MLADQSATRIVLQTANRLYPTSSRSKVAAFPSIMMVWQFVLPRYDELIADVAPNAHVRHTEGPADALVGERASRQVLGPHPSPVVFAFIGRLDCADGSCN